MKKLVLAPELTPAKVRNLLKGLGTTPNAVAKSLSRIAMIGEACSSTKCPLARYLNTKVGGPGNFW